MGEERTRSASNLFHILRSFMLNVLFRILSVGPMPNHIAFIMDGNRRYCKKNNLKEGDGHKDGFAALMTILTYCYELGVKYATIFAFSIDNFRRRPEEVQYVMDLMQEKLEGMLREESIVNHYGIRVHFIGNLKLLHEPVRVAAEKAMRATAKNTKFNLLICAAYTSSDEIAHAVQESCLDKWEEIKASNGKKGEIQAMNGVEIEEKQGGYRAIQLVDIEKHMYMSVAPDPDILIRTSGETRLSDFLLWQSTNTLLYCPKAFWPEIGLRQLVWAILNFQRNYFYFEKKKKQL